MSQQTQNIMKKISLNKVVLNIRVGKSGEPLETAKAAGSKIKNSGKTHAHKIQAAIAMEQRAKVMKKNAEAAVYRKYIEKMKKITKQKDEDVKSFKEMFDGVPYGEWGTEELINKYKAETPGETVILKRKDDIEEAGLWANIHKRRKSGKKMRKPGEKGAPTKKAFKSASEGVDESLINIKNELDTIRQRLEKARKDKQTKEVQILKKTLKNLEAKKRKILTADINEKKSEPWEKGYTRRVVKTTKPEHKEKGYNWRIKGKERDEISIKLYKSKPDFSEFKKQMKRVAGHEFGG